MEVPDREGPGLGPSGHGDVGPGRPSLDLVWDVRLLQEVLSHPNVNVVKTISAGLRRQVGMCVSELLRAVVARPQDEKGYVRLFLFLRAVLRNMPWADAVKLRRKKRWHAQRRFTLTCLNDWNAGGLPRDNLVRAALDLPPVREYRAGSTEVSNLRRCERIAREDGQFGKALKSLRSYGVAASTPETLQALRDLHPEGHQVPWRDTFPDGIEVGVDIVYEMLRSFKKGTASGRSGWSVTHLMECASDQSGVATFRDNLADFVNLFLSGRALRSFATLMSGPPC